VAEAILGASNLVRRYASGFRLVVERLELAAGEVLCVLGPTGAGKSTLLKLLAGIEQPDSGLVSLSGAAECGDGHVTVAYVPQRPLLLRGSVWFNLEVGLRSTRVSRQQRAEAVRQVAAALQLEGLLRRSARALSGGQMRLVALGRALVLRPRILLVDEPTADLDPGRGARVEQVLLDVARQRRVGIVWTTHNLFQARRVADRVLFVCDGQAIESGPTEHFFCSPQQPLTRRFLRGELLY